MAGVADSDDRPLAATLNAPPEDILHHRVPSDPDRAPPQTQTLTDATRRRRVLAHRLSLSLVSRRNSSPRLAR